MEVPDFAVLYETTSILFFFKSFFIKVKMKCEKVRGAIKMGDN